MREVFPRQKTKRTKEDNLGRDMTNKGMKRKGREATEGMDRDMDMDMDMEMEMEMD